MRELTKILLAIVIGTVAFFSIIGWIYYSSRDTAASHDKLVVVSPHPVEFMKPLVHEFENETGIEVELVDGNVCASSYLRYGTIVHFL